MIIFRTHPEHIPKVVELSMHALASSPTISPGDLILISQTIAHAPRNEPPIQYAMEFVKIRPDRTGDTSRRIWGKAWKYIVYGQNCRKLKTPFDIRHLQISNQNYGQGGPFVYVDSADEQIILQQGLLA